MTRSTAAHAQMSLEDFETLARRAPETVTLEFINGKLGVKPLPDQRHGAIVMWLLRQCMQQRPELALYPGQGLKVESYRTGRARADGALAPYDHYAAQEGEWADPAGTLMVVEVTSFDPDTDQRDRRGDHPGHREAQGLRPLTAPPRKRPRAAPPPPGRGAALVREQPISQGPIRSPCHRPACRPERRRPSPACRR